MNSENSDKIIAFIKLAKEGHQSGFTALLDTYWFAVYQFLLKQFEDDNNAEDITIQTFSKAFDKIDSYSESYNFKNWIITIAKNLYIDFLRKNKNDTQTQPLNDYDTFSEEDIQDIITRNQSLDTLLSSIKKLKPQYQQIIQLKYFQEMSFLEISEYLNESLSSVKVKSHRAKKLLAQLIR